MSALVFYKFYRRDHFNMLYKQKGKKQEFCMDDKMFPSKNLVLSKLFGSKTADICITSLFF